MVTTKKLLLIFCLTNIFYTCGAQYIHLTKSQWDTEHKKLISRVPFIVEGTVIRQSMFTSQNGQLLTCSILRIDKIYKGTAQIIIGTIKIITFQSGGSVTVSDMGEGLYVNQSYIVLGSQADSSHLSKNMLQTDNIATIYLNDQIDLVDSTQNDFTKKRNPSIIVSDTTSKSNTVTHHYIAAKWDRVGYKSMEELYEFFKSSGITIQ